MSQHDHGRGGPRHDGINAGMRPLARGHELVELGAGREVILRKLLPAAEFPAPRL